MSSGSAVNLTPVAATGSAPAGFRKRFKFPAWIVLPICLSLFAVKAITSLVQESATWDETFYFGLGKYLVETGQRDSFASNSHPPLSFYLNSIPFLFVHTHSPAWNNQLRDEAGSPDYHHWDDISREQVLLSSDENRDNRLLFFSRFVMVALAMVLGCYVFFWALSLYGDWAATIAIILFSFCPNMLAHARLITPDIVLTAFSFVTMYHFWKLLKTERTGDAVLCGVALGLTLLSKFTGLLLVPVCLVIAIVYRFRRNPLPVTGFIIVSVLAIIMVFLGYQGHIENYWSGIQFQQIHAHNGQWCFLAGQYSEKGWWYFYPLAFLIKTPIALIILFISALFIFCLKLYRKSARIDELFLFFPAAAVFIFFSASPLCLGLRYILPIYPFLFVLSAGAAAFFIRKKIAKFIVAALLAWYVGASFYIHPYYLAYFNELVGGPGEGYKWLVDSNLDWGQDLKGLGDYMQKHGISRVSLSYFGSDLPERYGIAYDWLPSFVLRNPEPGRKEILLHDYIAISATNLQGLYFHSRDKFAFLRTMKPVTKIGYSIFLYDVRR